MPNRFQNLMPSWHKLPLMGVSLAAMSTLIACTPAQYNIADYETNARSVYHNAQPAHATYAFYGHHLDSYQTYQIQSPQVKTPQVKTPQIQKFASAQNLRLNPYVQPTQTFGPQTLEARNFATTWPSAPALRPRFQYHLGGPVNHFGNSFDNYVAPRPVLEQTTAPQNIAKFVTPPAITPPAQFQPVVEPQLQPNIQANLQAPTVAQAAPLRDNFTLQAPKPSSPAVINLSELNQAVDVSPLGKNQFIAGSLPNRDLSIPELPEPQKQVIRQEQAALAGIENKSVLAGPTSLRSSLDSAFARSSRLAAESLRVDEAEEVLKQAESQSKLRVELNGVVGPRQSSTTFAFSEETISGSTIRRSAELDLSLPIYQGGRLRAERSSAKLGIEAARAGVAQTRGDIIQETAIAYLDVVRDRQLTELYHKNVDLLSEQQNNAAELLAVNESTISEKALIDARLASQRIRLETGLGTLRESEAHYKNLVGQAAPQHLPVPSFNVPLSLTEIQALAQQNNPELSALISQAKSAEYDVDIAKSGNKPSLNLQGVLRGAEGQSETIDRNTAAELLLNLRVPITQGGEGKSRVRQAKIVRNRLNLEIRDTQDSLRDQIDQLWARKIASEKSQIFNNEQIEATQFAVNTVAEQRAEGVATVLDVLNVQQSLLDAQIQSVEAQSRHDAASVQLLSLMGVYQ